MELWIRTQDKTTLIRSYEIYIAEGVNDVWLIRAKRTSHILGAYKTYKRAIEVLDEIQEMLKPTIIVNEEPIAERLDGIVYTKNNFEIVSTDVRLYEMPKE